LDSELAEAESDGGCNNTFELGLYEDGRANDDKMGQNQFKSSRENAA